MRYVPILKAKRAELGALSTEQVNCPVEPVFEIQHADWTQDAKTGKSVATDAASFIDSLRRQWWKPAFVDLSRVASTPTNRASWWALLHALTSMPRVPTHHLSPVFTPSDTPAVLNAAQSFTHTTGRALLRIPAPHPNIPSLIRLHHDFAKALKIPKNRVDLLIDWSNSTEAHNLDDMENHAKSIVSALPSDVPVVVAGTPNTGICTQAGQWDFNRREWWLWLRLNALNLHVDFGDYALFPPQPPGRGTPTYGHLRYSVNDTLHVERQKASVGGLGAGFKMCCDNLIALRKFAGATFSLGDSNIADIVNGAIKVPGASEQWRTIALQHHLRLVDGQLASPPPAPAVGTI